MVSTAELQQVMREMTSSIVQAIGESHSSINENLRLANNVQDKVKRTRNIQLRQRCSRPRSQVSQGNASSSDSSESEEDLGLSRGCTNTHIQEKGLSVLFVCFVNSYGHCGTVSSPNHTFSWAGLNKRLTSNSCTYFRL